MWSCAFRHCEEAGATLRLAKDADEAIQIHFAAWLASSAAGACENR
jgi:hypothetical protein